MTSQQKEKINSTPQNILGGRKVRKGLRALTEEEQHHVDQGCTRREAMKKCYNKKYNDSYYKKNKEELCKKFRDRYVNEVGFREKHLKYQETSATNRINKLI